MPKKQSYVKVALISLFALVLVLALVFFDAEVYLDPDVLREEMRQLGATGPAVFISIFIVASLFLPITPMAIAAGVLTGTFVGTILVSLGSILGALLAFVVARFLGRDFVQRYISAHIQGRLRRHVAPRQSDFTKVLMLRFIPVLPFNGLNFSLGVSNVGFRPYALATAIGVIPYSFVAAYFGSSLATLQPLDIFLAGIMFVTLLIVVPLTRRLQRKSASS